MEQRSDIHQREGGKSRERFVGEAAGNVQETTHRPRSTIVPSALDEPFTEPEVFEGHRRAGTRFEVKNFEGTTDVGSFSRTSISGLATADVPSADLDDEMDSGPPTQPRISVLPLAGSQISDDSQASAQARYEPVPVHSHVKDKFYLRLELRKDCLADLWVRDLTPHNVLAWSDGMESWVPLLTVPELREAIRTAQDRKTRDLLSNSQPPPALVVPSSESRIPLPPPRRAGSIVSAAPARAGKFWHMPHPRPAMGSGTIPAPPLSPQSSRPPPFVEGTPRRTSSPPPRDRADRSSVAPPPRDRADRSSVAPPPPSMRPAAVTSTPPSMRPAAVTSIPPSMRPAAVTSKVSSAFPVAAPKRTSILPPPTAQRSSVPPAGSMHGTSEVFRRGESIPDFPRPARVPSFVEPVAAPAKQKTPAAKTANHGTLMPRSVSLSPVANWSLRGVGLVNLERAVWLAAGISVATAASFILRGSASGTSAAASKDASSIAGMNAQTNAQTNASDGALLASSRSQGFPHARNGKETRSTVSTESAPDAAKVEDLPLVGSRGAGRGAARASSISPSSRTAENTPVVQAESLTLASQPTTPIGPAKPSSAGNPAGNATKPLASSSDGAFDPAQARRVLASAAARARSCAEGGLSGAVQVTFAPSGFVQGASLLNLSGEGVRSGCVLRAFQEARVSPFVGASVAVKKSFAFP